MPSTFIALPLSSGEAFLLKTLDKSGLEKVILVDSGKKYGKNTRELAKVLSQIEPEIKHIDIAVCTHSDADHSQGYWHFAEDWYGIGRTIGEFWLPGRWANAMPEILTNPLEFATELMTGAYEAAIAYVSDDTREKKLSREESFRSIAVGAEANVLSETLDRVDLNKEISVIQQLGLTKEQFEALQADSEETDKNTDIFDNALLSLSRRRSNHVWLYEPYLSDEIRAHQILEIRAHADVLFSEVIDTAKAIRKITMSAFRFGIRVRWFDFGKYELSGKPEGGETDLLVPLCSVEVLPQISPTKGLPSIALFHSIRLSRQNVESLVFYRPETESEPGVMFLGDSRLAYGIQRPKEDFQRSFEKPTRKILVTAPHHGSRNNDHAYQVLDKWITNTQHLFIRNGGQTGQVLGDYLSINNRRCAQCVQCHGNKWKQEVSINSLSGNWVWPPKANACSTP